MDMREPDWAYMARSLLKVVAITAALFLALSAVERVLWLFIDFDDERTAQVYGTAARVANPDKRLFYGYGDGGGDAVDPLGIGLLEPLEELPGVGRKALDIAALSLGVERVQRQAALAAAAEAAQHDQLPVGEVQVNRLEVVDLNPSQHNMARTAHDLPGSPF